MKEEGVSTFSPKVQEHATVVPLKSTPGNSVFQAVLFREPRSVTYHYFLLLGRFMVKHIHHPRSGKPQIFFSAWIRRHGAGQVAQKARSNNNIRERKSTLAVIVLYSYRCGSSACLLETLSKKSRLTDRSIFKTTLTFDW